MRLSVTGLILLLLILTTIGCQNGDAPTRKAPLTTTPRPTPLVGVAFATVTRDSTEATRLPSAELAPETRPAISATVAATATAVSYFVQAGDTLVSIAATQGLGLDELLALNPGLQPELLLVGQEIYLPAKPIEDLTAPDTEVFVTGAPVEIEISALSTYNSVDDRLWVLGEVHNTGPQTVELVQVAVRLLTEEDQELSRQELWVTPVTIPAGGRAPFGVLMPNTGVAEARAEAEVVAGRPIYELGNRYLDLAVTDAEVTIGPNPIEVGGRLDNLGDSPAGMISIISTFYDDQGLVTGYHEFRLEGTIMPGDGLPFNFTVLPPGGRVDSYDFAIQSVVAE
jgi:LysM repeat protein